MGRKTRKKHKPVIYGPPVINKAALESGYKGAVLKRPLEENRRVAKLVESAVGPWKIQGPHVRHAGPRALPHLQQKDETHFGHSFYETEFRKAKAKS